MQITIADLINAKPAIEKLTQQNLPARKSFQITKLMKVLNDEFTTFETCRVELVKKYGTLNEEGNWVADNNHQEFISEIQSLLLLPCTISDDLKVDLSNELDSLSMTVADMIALEPLFQFE
jgi:hypothetical protein